MTSLNVKLLKCNKCGDEKPVNMFSLTPAGNPRNACKACRSKANSGQVRKDRYLKATYGITHADYLRMLEEQDGCCAICDTPAIDLYHGVLDVDHNHETGEVRGLLCNSCNRLLGFAGDSKERLKRAVVYLKERGSYDRS